LRCAQAALAAERFRLAQGRLPDSLNALMPNYLPELPIDPFDGQPLKFRATDEGITIYSIYENEQDDEGRVEEGPGEECPLDVGFRLFRPELRRVVILEEQEPAVP
jgi:hypothetical protein